MPRRIGACARDPLQVRERAARDEPAMVDDDERLAECLGHLHLVGREDDRATFIAELDERLAEERQVHRVETRERLIHEQDLGPVQDRGDELDLLLLALA